MVLYFGSLLRGSDDCALTAGFSMVGAGGCVDWIEAWAGCGLSVATAVEISGFASGFASGFVSGFTSGFASSTTGVGAGTAADELLSWAGAGLSTLARFATGSSSSSSSRGRTNPDCADCTDS